MNQGLQEALSAYENARAVYDRLAALAPDNALLKYTVPEGIALAVANGMQREFYDRFRPTRRTSMEETMKFRWDGYAKAMEKELTRLLT
ncbi:MAG: hypothetical protein ACP5NS_03590 [Candidatus Pacearchaeota archaeon]